MDDMHFKIFVENVLIFEDLFLNDMIILSTWKLVVGLKKKEFDIGEFRKDGFEERLSDGIDASMLFPTAEKCSLNASAISESEL